MLDNILTPKPTDDGSYTFFSEEFNELFHSHSGAKQEAQYKFSEPCQLKEKASSKNTLKILDICYGLGYNSAAALETIWSINPHCQVELIALEKDETVPLQAISHQLLNSWSSPVVESLNILAQTQEFNNKTLKAKLLLGDARQTIKILDAIDTIDAIFLDPFSPPKCPQLWTVEFMQLIAKCLHKDGYLATYSCAASVRNALQLAGLKIGATRSVGRRSPGTVANWTGENLPILSQQEIEHLNTRAAIPYRDPNLEDSAEMIHQRRQKEQEKSNLEPSSHWKKRWINKH
ncbi:tRNA (5-methylaminomethyl-2-thiouridine)(34)-methyltransferase MnmD [Crocosphaera sp. XPORK-15E]|uniref:tRNA (5-methylaminomethyl-2-thiouridine)(34)-methyltransferase MnmD n=1 Tax=Crocosphaera sp. XPORK-15E TaxID=3110247 RepID=UPI002B1F6D71|nr:MnmC family methyltransferase [Crocosphaera sp. XPORK-15E]MEA5534557.1 MnmC family methyltransferase [Crocosphaera sp. XPORK-15E]